MDLYYIKATTNRFIAQRKPEFNNSCNIIIANNLTLKEANKKLLELWNKSFADERGYATNWSVAVRKSKKYPTDSIYSGKFRAFEDDGVKYSIEYIL